VISVLLVDDDRRLRELLSSYLAENGLSVTCAHDGLAALETMKSQTFDAVLLDIMMPGLDGIEVLRRIRTTLTTPVIMLTARGDETDRVVGLEIGADDYVSKPFSPRELLARIRAVLRRTGPSSQTQRLQEGSLRVDLETREVTQHGQRIELTGLEFDILTTLLRRAGRVISREALIEETARGAINDRAIDVHVSHLRQKLGAETIRTVRGVGYVFTKAGT
jgi:two-component system, OmpR family, response regulator